MASIWKLPVVYVCENNLYAASTPFTTAFAIQSVVERAAAYGMPGEKVDGNDVLAVYEAASRSVARARAGGGPTLLYCASPTDSVVIPVVIHAPTAPGQRKKIGLKRDPIQRLAERMLADDLATGPSLADVENEVTIKVDEAVAFAEASPTPEPSDTLTNVFYQEAV